MSSQAWTPSDLLTAVPFWVPEADDFVRCLACSRECRIPPGQTGFCRVRVNQDGKLVRPYEHLVSAMADDPIEKKPLFHYRPGSRVFSLGGWGCNFICPWCQNHLVSQNLPKSSAYRTVTAKQLVDQALRGHFPSLAFTYNEPTVAIEFVLETFRLAKEAGLQTVLVTNGSMGARGARVLSRVLDAVNVDLKGFNAERMRQVVNGELGATLASIESFRAAGVWTEVTTLVVPDFNDDLKELSQLAQWVSGIGRSTVWHLSAFHPDYHYRHTGPTPMASLLAAQEQGFTAGLNFVYLGNVPSEVSFTNCPSCKTKLVERQNGQVTIAAGFDGQCPNCGASVPGRWS